MSILIDAITTSWSCIVILLLCCQRPQSVEEVLCTMTSNLLLIEVVQMIAMILLALHQVQ